MSTGAWRKIRSFLRHDPFVQAWFLPAWLGLGAARALVLTLSFRRVAPRLGHAVATGAVVPLLEPALARRALLVARTIRLAAAYTPWDSNCFPQAIVARVLLGIYRVPYALYFGVMRDAGEPSGLKAHAWVASGPVAVTGGIGFEQYSVVGCYVSRGLVELGPGGETPRRSD